MKKLYLPLLSMLCVGGLSVLNSCSDNDSTSPAIPESENVLICNDVVQEIKSAVYTVETPVSGKKSSDLEAVSAYTIYLSRTGGLVDEDGMLIADNAVRITALQPSGDVDLSVPGNGVSYGDIELNSSNIGDATKAALSVEFLSNRVVSISADIEIGGKTLRVAYYGICRNSEASQEIENAKRVLLDKVPLSWYCGPVKKGESHNYYLIFTDTDNYSVSRGEVTLNEAGYLLLADLYAAPGEDVHTLPEGEYMSSPFKEDHTFDPDYTGVQYFDEEGKMTQLTIVSGEPVKVSRDGDVWSISLRFKDKDGTEKSIVYEGSLKIVDQPEGGGFYLPQIGRDVEVVGTKAAAIYSGNMLEAGTGMMQITIYDETYDKEEGKGGLGATLIVFHDLFGNPKDAAIKPCEYTPSTSFLHSTWMPAVEIPVSGMVFPLGTYVHMDDGTNYGKFSYGKEGTIKIEDAGTSEGVDGKTEPQYKIEFNLTSKDGFTLKGSYTGVIPITDQSNDKSDDDGTSTLERDYDMNLSKITKAHLYTSDQIYIQSLGYKPVSSYSCGLQFINIGKATDFSDREPGGDIVRMELVTEPGKENVITPGTYEVTEQRWPAYIKPGVMMRGIMLAGDLHGSRWMHQYPRVVDGQTYEYMDGHALFYGGKVTITKVEGEGKDNWYKFEFDATCVRKHHVRGTWEGPVEGLSGISKASASAAGANSESSSEPSISLRYWPDPNVTMNNLMEKLPR